MQFNTQFQTNLNATTASTAPAHIRQPRAVSLDISKSYESFYTTSFDQFQKSLSSLSAMWLPETWVQVDKNTIADGKLELGREQLLQLYVHAYDYDRTWFGGSPYNPILRTKNIQSLTISQSIGWTKPHSHTAWFRTLLQKFNGLLSLELFSGVHATAYDLSLIASQRNLLRLDLSPLINISDNGLSKISTLTNLHYLGLRLTHGHDDGDDKLTANGYQHLQKLEHLTHLKLTSRSLNTEAMEQIGKLQGLKYLGLNGAKFNEADLKHLQSLPSLKRLDINTYGLEGVGLKYISQLESLEVLTIKDPRTISDKGLEQLANLKHLRILAISTGRTRFDYPALMELRHLDALEEFNASGNQATLDQY